MVREYQSLEGKLCAFADNLRNKGENKSHRTHRRWRASRSYLREAPREAAQSLCPRNCQSQRNLPGDCALMAAPIGTTLHACRGTWHPATVSAHCGSGEMMWKFLTAVKQLTVVLSVMTPCTIVTNIPEKRIALIYPLSYTIRRSGYLPIPIGPSRQQQFYKIIRRQNPEDHSRYGKECYGPNV